MGLLSSLFGKPNKPNKPRVAAKQPFYDIICPYCFEKFSPEEVVFRASHFVEGDLKYALQEDKLLNAYREKLNLAPLYDIEAVIDAKLIHESKKKYVDNVLVEIIDEHNQKTKKRLCPHCHNELPLTSGKVPSNIISFIGASQVGKSVYMTALIHILQNFTANNFNAACVPINTAISQRYKEYYELPLYNNGNLLDATQKEQRSEPLIFQFKFKNEEKHPITLVFFDVAGEGMMDQKYLDIFASNIKNSSGLLFLVDPLQIRTIREKIGISRDDETGDFADMYAEPEDVLVSLFENFIGEQERQVTNIPTAVTLTKSDMLSSLDDEEYISKNSNIFINYNHKESFNLTEFENIDGEVRRFIEKVDLKFKNALDVYFKNRAFFAVSALGSNPVNQRLNDVINSTRVDEPFLWILYKLGYIDGRR